MTKVFLFMWIFSVVFNLILGFILLLLNEIIEGISIMFLGIGWYFVFKMLK